MEYWEDYDVLRVETPENLELRFPLAGFGPRFLALFIDTIWQTLAGVLLWLVLIAVIFGLATGAENMFSDESALFLIIVFFVFGTLLVSLGYYILFEYIWNGQTPGKRLAGIRVVRRGGLPLTFRDVLLRNLLRLVDSLPSYYFVGLVSFFVTRNQQRLGDLVADTVVIREFVSRTPYFWVGGEDSGHRTPDSGLRGTLTPKLSHVIGSYLFRAPRFPVETRLEVSGQCIRELGYDPDSMSLQDREAYLASVMRQQQGGYP